MFNLYKRKVLVVGAGLAGSTISRVLAENGIKIVVIDKRNHIAGNIYDFVNDNNERIHRYGPHLLHCNKSSEGLRFLSRFTTWIKYEHRVRAQLENGMTTSLPINKNTIQDIYKKKFESEKEVKDFIDSVRNRSLIPKNTDELFEASVGNKLADIFLRPYTKKMWGIDPKELVISIGARLPVRTNSDSRYFNDNFQALPKSGYTKMIENMLDHSNIKINLRSNYQKGMEIEYDHAFLCTPIDEFFDYEFGQLPYRSILFENRLEKGNDLDSPVVNFTDSSPYTRKTQWNLFPNSPNIKGDLKTITYEKPCSIDLNPGEYYYPVQTKDSKRIFSLYEALSKNQSSITFIGRTGLFKYIDMIPAVEIHLRIAKNFVKKFQNFK